MQHVYRALEVISNEMDFIQSSLYSNSLKITKRNTGILYYECTNYFFEIEQEKDLKQYGASKEHRPNPIIQMDIMENTTSTLRASMGGNLPILMANQHGNSEIYDEQCSSDSINEETIENNQTLLFDNHAKDCRFDGSLNVAQAVAAIYDTGSNKMPLVSKQMRERLHFISNSLHNNHPTSSWQKIRYKLHQLLKLL